MSEENKDDSRVVRAFHSLKEVKADPDFELGLSDHLRASQSQEHLIELYGQFVMMDGAFGELMRRAIWRSIAKRFGHGVHIGTGVGFKHLETFEIGNGVFIGSNAYLQGRFDGRFVVGDHVWIGPHSYFDARDLVLGEYVGWGPGAKVLGSMHTGDPIEVPIIQTDLEIKPVRIGPWVDIGTNAVLLPGIKVGNGSIVGAGAVVTGDVAPYAIVAGVPAKFVRWREGHKPSEKVEQPK